MKLALAEMYVKGVSTRKVQSILEELCGLEVSSSQVSRAAELLDAELESWFENSAGIEWRPEVPASVKAIFFDRF